MGRIPTYNRQVTRGVIPDGTINVRATPEAFGAASGRNLESVGNTIQDFSSGMQRVQDIKDYKQQVAQEKADRIAEQERRRQERASAEVAERSSKLRSTDAMNRALSEMREVNGRLRTMQGTEALNVTSEGEKSYNEILKKYNDELNGDERAQELFSYGYSNIMNSRLDALEGQRENALTMMERETAFARNAEIEKQGIDDLYGDHSSKLQALMQNTAGVYRGLSPEDRQDKEKEAASAYLEKVYTAMKDTPNGLRNAEALREKYKSVWDPKTYKALGGKAEQEIADLDTKDEALKLFHEKTPEEREAYLREKVSDPKKEAELRKHIDIWQTQTDRLQKQKDEAAVADIWGKIEKSGYSEDMIARLPSQELRDKAYVAKKKQAERPGEWDLDTFHKLDAMPSDRFTSEDLSKYGGDLTAEHYKALKSRQDDLQGLNGEKARKSAKADSAWKSRFDDYFGYLNSAKNGEDGRNQYNQAYRNVLDQFEATPPKNAQEIESALQKAAEKSTLEINWGFDKTQTRATFKPEELRQIEDVDKQKAAENRVKRLESNLGTLQNNRKLPDGATVARSVPAEWPAETAYFVKTPMRELEREVETRSKINVPFITDIRTRDTVAPEGAFDFSLYNDSGKLLGVVKQYPAGWDVKSGKFNGTLRANDPGWFDAITNPINEYYNAPQTSKGSK